MSREVELGSCIADVTKSADNTSSPESNPPGEKRATKHGIVVAMIVIAVLSLVGLVALVAFSLWRRKQRQEAQARFVQLFEDDDFLDEEADLKDDL
jgi:predicted RNA polymerase sigma factor